MIRIWIFVVLSAALAQTTNLGLSSNIYGKLDDGCHDCYPCGHQELMDYSYRGQINNLSIIDEEGRRKVVCCKPLNNSMVAKGGDVCGKRTVEGIPINGAEQKRTHIRATLIGEYPWRAWIWRRGDSRPFCSGFVLDENTKAIVTSATCALKYPEDSLVVTFTRTLETASDVINVRVHEEYAKAVPLVNNIALLYRDQRKQVPDWVMHACSTSIPPFQSTYCVVMSEQDYFIDTIVLPKRKCRVGNMELHVSQMCTQFIKGDYEPEMGAGLFCRARMRTRTNDYYAYGITLQVSDEFITYTDVSHFKKWILEEKP